MFCAAYFGKFMQYFCLIYYIGNILYNILDKM